MKSFRLIALAPLAISVCLAATPSPGTEPSLVDAAFRRMYDLDFEGAHRALAEWMRLHPDDPLGPAADAAAHLFTEFDRLRILQSEFFTNDSGFLAQGRLAPNPVEARAFEQRLAQARQLASSALVKSPKDTNALFAQLLVYGLRSDYDGLIEKKYLSSLTTTKQGRQLAEKLLAVDDGYADAWLAIGVENYLLSLKPLPVRWFLRLYGNSTDKELGLEKLRITAEKGRYLRPFAQLLLAVASLRDRDVAQGRRILESLQAEFPHNHLYREELARLREKGN